jgi:hypothetical protein
MSTVIQQISANTTIERTVAITEVGNPGPQGLAAASALSPSTRHDYVAPYSYCGKAVSGSLDSADVWTITRINIATNGTTTTAQAINVAWTDRLTATYT